MQMLNTQLLGVLLFYCVLGLSAQVSLHDPEADRELARYRERVKLVHDLLLSEKCPDPDIRVKRRAPDDSKSELLLEIEKALFEELIDKLVECRMVVHQPELCEEAVNLTEVWRHENSPRNQRPVGGSYNCDPSNMTSQGNPWFRFSGAAGSRLLDHCINHYRCGTHATLWSNATMPTEIGVVTTIPLYASYSSKCDQDSFTFSVMRCSDEPHDLIYRWTGSSTCDFGFCGMS